MIPRRVALYLPLLIAGSAVVFAADSARERIDCSNPNSTVEMNYCTGLELEAADTELNDVYQRSIAAIPGMATDPPYDAKSWENALRASQRAWVAFRDAECNDHVPMFWGGGTGTTAEVIDCKTALTRARTKQLKDRYIDAP